MANPKEHLRSAKKGCRQLASLLENFDDEACPKCGHGRRLPQHAAQELDGKIWEALRYAEAR